METGPQLQKESKPDKETSLKGAFASVMLLGAFLAASWVLVFILFMTRQ